MQETIEKIAYIVAKEYKIKREHDPRFEQVCVEIKEATGYEIGVTEVLGDHPTFTVKARKI